MSAENSAANIEKITTIKKEILKLWVQEEKYWSLRSRLKWLKWGDKNSKFFHATTIQWQDRNKIQRLKNVMGEWIDGQEDVTKLIMEHFKTLYQSQGTHNIDPCLAVIPKLVDDSMNAELCQEISESEIKRQPSILEHLKLLEVMD